MRQRVLAQFGSRREVVTIPGESTVFEAAQFMRNHHIGAVMVTRGDRLVGIISERDVVQRVVAQGLEPRSVRVADVMTAPVITATAKTKAVEALRVMQENNFRHLPVVDAGGRAVAMVSIRDFLGDEMAEVQDEIAFEGCIERELW